MGERRFVRITVICVLSLTLAALAAVSIVSILKTRERERIQSEYDYATRDLRLEKTALESRYDAILDEHIEAAGVKSTLSFAFIDLAPILYETAFPMFEGGDGDIDIDGILCFDKENIPGMEGRITLSQYEEIIDAGWSTALYYDGYTAGLRDWLGEMSELLSDAGLSMPETAVFAEGSDYSSAADGILLEFGIDTAVHYGKEEFPLLEVTEGEGGVWHPGICGWLTDKVTNRMYNLLLRDGGHFFFAVGFDEIDRAYSYDPNNRTCVSQFARMISRIRDSVGGGELAIYSDLDAARSYRAEYNARSEEAIALAEEERALILKRIDELDLEMLKIFEQHFG